MNKQTKGFSIIEIILVVAILAIIGLIGWRVWDANQNKDAAQDTTTQQDQSDIKTTEDLDKAGESLDSTDVVGGYEQELDAETDF
jgi:prepilin-type N-terminal cleavage/methylation domain-containing protein